MQVQNTRNMLLAGLLLCSACDKAGFNYDGITGGGNIQYTILDTLTIQMRTVQLDSVATSYTGTALIGAYNDPAFGRTTAATYFCVALPAAREVELKAVYDSIELIMKPNGDYYGDTLPQQRFTIHQLTQKLALPEGYTSLYSHHTFPANSAAWADVTRNVHPLRGDTMRIRLNDAKGLELFNMLQHKTQEVSSDDFFTEYFKGLTIRGAGTNTAIINFQARDSALFLRLHYHVTGIDIDKRKFDFFMSAPETQFNAITTDRTGTPLEKLGTVAGGLTGSQHFVQSLTKTATRMDFTSVQTLPQLSKYGRIMRAELTLRPVAGTYSDHKLPPSLMLGFADSRNQIASGDTLVSATGYQSGSLFTDYLNPENTRYTYDVTDYCRTLIQGFDSYSYRGLLAVPSGAHYHTNFNRVVLGDGTNSSYRAKLNIYYLLYK